MVTKMTRYSGLGLVVMASFGCSSASSQSCSDVRAELESYARQPHPPNYPNGYDGNGDGKPDAAGICASSDASIKHDTADLCAQARSCQ